MRRTRVARVITRLNIGGPAIQAVLLTERLDPERYETLLVCGLPGEAEGDMLDLRLGRNVRPVIIRELRRDISPLADALAFMRLVVLFLRFRPDVVHTHLAKAGLLGRIAARLTGTRVVVHTFHGNVLRGYFTAGASNVFLTLERLLARITTRLIAISPAQHREIEALRIATADRLVEIPLGLDLAPFRAPRAGALRAELRIDSATPLIGMVSRFVPVKAVDVFIAACAEIALARPEVRFVLVGDGQLRPAIVAQADALGLHGAIRFLGWRSDLAEIYADLDVLVLTSQNEGTPVTVLEALAVGTPIVATSVGGVPDVIGDDERGVLVPPGRPLDVARAVLSLLADEARRAQLRAAGPPWVFARHDSAILVQRIDDLYTSLIR